MVILFTLFMEKHSVSGAGCGTHGQMFSSGKQIFLITEGKKLGFEVLPIVLEDL